MTMKNVVSLYKPEAPFAAVARVAFSDALDRMARVVDQKNTVPILRAVRIQTFGGRMIITGTDLNIEMKIAVPITADSSDMTAVIDLEDMRKFLRLAAGDFIRITSDEEGERASIFCGGSDMIAPVYPAVDWPDEPMKFERKGSSSFSISPSVFRHGIDSVMPAMSSESTKYYLNGANFRRVDDMIRFEATDGHRLHRRDSPFEGRSKFTKTGILPASLLTTLKGCLEPRSYGQYLNVAMSGDGVCLRFTLADMVITAKLIDGEFPDCDRVFPASSETTIEISGEAVKRFLDGVSDATAARLSIFHDTVVMDAKVDDTTRRSEIDASVNGNPLVIAFQPKYLRDAIDGAAPGGGKVKIELISGETPAKITGPEKHFVCVLMPKRV